MTTKFEDAIAAAKAAHYDQPETVQLIELIVAQNERIKNLEHFQLEAKSRLGATEKAVGEHEVSIASLAKSRDETVTRVTTIEGKPDKDTKAIAELDKRVTVVEGAVGSKAFRKAENKTVVVETPAGTVVEPAPKPHFWETPKPAETIPV